MTGREAQARWLLTCDDFGPAVQSDETHPFAGGTYRVRTRRQTGAQSFQSADFARLGADSGRAILTGREQETAPMSMCTGRSP